MRCSIKKDFVKVITTCIIYIQCTCIYMYMYIYSHVYACVKQTPYWTLVIHVCMHMYSMCNSY